MIKSAAGLPLPLPPARAKRAGIKTAMGTIAVIALLLGACGELTPSGNYDQLIINEVYTGANPGGLQWIELLNNTNADTSLEGIRLETRAGTINVGAIAAAGPSRGMLGKGATLVISNYPQTVVEQIYRLQTEAEPDETKRAAIKRRPPALPDNTVLGKLAPTGDLLVLKTANGTILDQVGWGTGDPALRTSLEVTSNINLDLPAPAFDNKSLGRTPYLGQREPTDPGTINPGVFTLHNTPSPYLNTTPAPIASYNFVLRSLTDVIATIGGALLWAAFFIIALVAKRFETLSGQKTYWRYLMIAPAGILIYAIIQVYCFIAFNRLPDQWSWPAFLALFFSGLACVYVVNIFRLIAKNILEAE